MINKKNSNSLYLFTLDKYRLNHYYNFFSFDSVFRPSIFLSILKFSINVEKPQAVLPAISQVDQLIIQWKSSVQQKREIYNLVCQILRLDNANSKPFYESLKKYLATYENSEDDVSPVLQHAVDAALLAIKLENIHQYDDLLELRAMKQVNSFISFLILLFICLVYLCFEIYDQMVASVGFQIFKSLHTFTIVF